MTDFTSLAHPGDPVSVPGDSWDADDPAASRSNAPGASAASLAAAVRQLLEAATAARVPRLERLRQRLRQAEAAWDLAELDGAVHALHDAAAAVDFHPGRGGDARAQAFRRQSAAVVAAAGHLAAASRAFVARQAGEAALARLQWMELKAEYRALEKRVRKGLLWTQELERVLAARQVGTTAEVSQQALQELARRCQVLEDRLHLVHGLCGAARAARGLGEQVAAQRAALGRTLHEQVRPCGLALQHRLEPLAEAAATRALEPAQLLDAIDAGHALQVALTRAGAELMQLQSLQEELQVQLAWMEQKAAQAVA